MCEDGRHDLHKETEKIEERMTMMMLGARILLIVSGTAGLYLTVTAGAVIADARVALNAGQTATIFAGQMIVAVGALRGHKSILSVMRREFDHINKRIDDRDRFDEAVVTAARDQLRRRREGG